MSLNLYQVSVPAYIHTLKALAGVLEKGAKHAEAKGIDPSVLLNSRLYPDMFPLVKQVQVASDNAKGGAARLAGQEPPKFEDDEKSFPELKARIEKTIAYLQSLKPEQFNGAEERTITLQLRAGTMTLTGIKFFLHSSLPNFFFHCTTAYDILRHNGVEIGKRDFLGNN
ncbi:MAG TPA: DUF1993 domain-containing protein [Burkholderiales bacterium]|nr:DUF1993 domain-containing protein [Burkholderiales bacterium]